MANFIPPQDDYTSQMYGSLGHLLGTGLGSLGGYIAQEYKAPELEKSFQSWGATPDQAKFLARQPPQQQQQWINQQQKMLAAQQRNRAIADTYAGKVPMGAGGQQIPTQPNENQPGNVMGQPVENVAPETSSKPDKRLDADMRKATRDMDHAGKNRLLQSGILNPQEADALRRQMEMERGNDIREEKFTHEKEEAGRKHEEAAYKMTEPFRAEAFKEEENAAHMQGVIGEQLQLSKSGKMNNAGFIEFLERFGMDFNALKNPKTEQYQSLEKEDIKDLKSIFGGKISNDEMKAFLKGIPKATNSPEARNAMLERWNAYFEAKGLKAKLIREITAKNNGVPPYNLRDQVAEKMNARQEQLSKQFLGIPSDAKEMLYDKKTGERAYIDKNGKIVELK